MREGWKAEDRREKSAEAEADLQPMIAVSSRDADARLGGQAGLLKCILDSLADGVVVADGDGNFLLFNEAAERILGMGAEDVDPHNWSSTYGLFCSDMVTPFPPEELPLAKALRGETVRDVEIFVRNPNLPEGAWICVNGSPLYDEEDGLCGGLALFRDMTEGKRAQNVAQRLSEAVERTTDCVFITDASGKIEYVNPAFEKTTGFSCEDALGAQPSILKSGVHDHQYYESLWKTILAGEVHRGTVINRKKDGDIFHAEQTITPIKDSAGNITHFVSVVKDVTELKKAEEREVEMRIARSVQQRLYPAQSPQVEGFDIAGAARCAAATGGDYYDFIPLDDGCLAIVIGDVSGHGAGPALLMAETRAYLRPLVNSIFDAGDVLRRLNVYLGAETGEKGLFVTLMLVRLDPRRGRLVYASAGHNPGYLLNPSGSIKHTLGATGLPLGLYPERPFKTSPEIQMERDDILFLLTDGLTETENIEGEFFGEDRAVEIVAAQRADTAKSIVESLYGAAREFASNAPQTDDITTVICKMTRSR